MNPISNFSKASSAQKVIAFFIFVAAEGFSLYRLFFGVNFFDEPFYSGIPLRFVLGQKLFIHEQFLLQSFGLVSYPLIKLHSFFFQGTDYIVLYLRFCYWFFYLALALILFRWLKKMITAPSALIISSSVGLFLPGNIPTLSYNTLGTFFLILGLFLLFEAVQKKRGAWYFSVGISLGLSCLSYNTLLVSILLVLFLMVWGRETRKFCCWYILGVFLVGVWPLILFLQRWHFVETAILVSKEYGYSSNKFLYFFTAIHKLFPKQVIAVLVLFFGSAFWSKTKKEVAFVGLVTAIPGVSYLLSQLSTSGWAVYPFYLSILSLIPFQIIKKEDRIRKLFVWVFVPSWVAGIVAGVSSNVGYTNSQVGLVPAFLTGLIFVAFFVQSQSKVDFRIQSLALGLPVFLAFFNPINIWDESPKELLTSRVDEGPFKGLFTTPQKQQYLVSVQKELRSSLDSRGPLMIFPNFTAGYLIAGIPPASGVIWYQNPKGGVDGYWARAYLDEMKPTSRLVRMKNWYSTPELNQKNYFDPQSPINQMIEKKHVLVKDTPYFELFRPRFN